MPRPILSTCSLPGDRASAVTDFGQKQASCLFHALALNHCQDFQEKGKWLVAFVKLRPYLSSQGWLVTGNELLHGSIPPTQPPRIWFSAWLCPRGTAWGGVSAVFASCVTWEDRLGLASVSKHCVVTPS